MRSDDVLSVLSRIFPDGAGSDIVTLGWVKGLVVQGNPKMYRCPRCGFTLRGHTIPAVPNLEGNNEQTNNPSGREAGPEGLPLP